jgi:hypothetical protein
MASTVDSHVRPSQQLRLARLAVPLLALAAVVFDVFLPRAWDSLTQYFDRINRPDLIPLLLVFPHVAYGQIIVLAAWTALGPGRHVSRILLATLIVVAVWHGLALLAMAQHNTQYSLTVYFGCGAVLLLFFAQVPFWILRIVFGWRLEIPGYPTPSPSRPQRFTIQQLLGTVAFVAVPLCVARALLGLPGWTVGLLGSMAAEVGIRFVASASCTALLIACCLRPSTFWRASGPATREMIPASRSPASRLADNPRPCQRFVRRQR